MKGRTIWRVVLGAFLVGGLVTAWQAALNAAQASLVTQTHAVAAARAEVQRLQTQIDDSSLRAPMMGRILYRLARPGEVLPAGGKALTLVDLSDVYMEIFLPSEQAARLPIGAEARIAPDGADFAMPATVSFVSPEAQFTPKQVETRSECEKLMFHVKVQIPPGRVIRHIELVKTGVRGVAYVRLDDSIAARAPARRAVTRGQRLCTPRLFLAEVNDPTPT